MPPNQAGGVGVPSKLVSFRLVTSLSDVLGVKKLVKKVCGILIIGLHCSVTAMICASECCAFSL